MALTFDHATKLIGVPQADAQPLLVQDLVNAIRTEEASERGIAYDQILDASGKEDLGGGVYTGITAGLRSTWKLNFAGGAYQATIGGGNVADVLARVNNTGSPQVLALSSAAATIISGSGGSVPTAAQNAAAVWASVLEGTLTAEQMQRILLAALAGKRAGLGTATEQYMAQDGTTPRVTFTPTDASGNGSTVLDGS